MPISEATFELEIKNICAVLLQKETEENWTRMEECLKLLARMSKESSHLIGFIPAFKLKLKDGLINCILTERTRLARSALSLIEEIASNLKVRFSELCDVYLPAVLRLTARANKVYVSSATQCLKTCINQAGLAIWIPYLNMQLSNPSKTLRIASMVCIDAIINSNISEILLHYAENIESCIETGVVDPTPEVRDLSRKIFLVYQGLFPDRNEHFIKRLPEIAKKYLKIEKDRPKATVEKPKFRQRTFDTAADMPADTAVLNSSTIEASVKMLDKPKRLQPDHVEPKPLQKTGQSTESFGPKRIIKEIPAEPKIKKRAQRIAVPDSLPPTPNPVEIFHSASQVKDNIKVSTAAKSIDLVGMEPESQLVKKTNILPMSNLDATELILKLPDLKRKLESLDWTTRCGVFETISTYLNSLSSLFTNPCERKPKQIISLFPLIFNGLEDGHFRVVVSTLAAADVLCNLPDFSLGFAELILPKIALAAVNVAYKNKPIVKEGSSRVINSIRRSFSTDALVGILFNLLSTREIQNLRLKQACIYFCGELKSEEWREFLTKQNNFKLLFSKLFYCAKDSDKATTLIVKEIVRRVFSADPVFWEHWETLKQSEQIYLNTIFGNDLKADPVLLQSVALARSGSVTPIQLQRSGSVTPTKENILKEIGDPCKVEIPEPRSDIQTPTGAEKDLLKPHTVSENAIDTITEFSTQGHSMAHDSNLSLKTPPQNESSISLNSQPKSRKSLIPQLTRNTPANDRMESEKNIVNSSVSELDKVDSSPALVNRSSQITLYTDDDIISTTLEQKSYSENSNNPQALKHGATQAMFDVDDLNTLDKDKERNISGVKDQESGRYVDLSDSVAQLVSLEKVCTLDSRYEPFVDAIGPISAKSDDWEAGKMCNAINGQLVDLQLNDKSAEFQAHLFNSKNVSELIEEQISIVGNAITTPNCIEKNEDTSINEMQPSKSVRDTFLIILNNVLGQDMDNRLLDPFLFDLFTLIETDQEFLELHLKEIVIALLICDNYLKVISLIQKSDFENNEQVKLAFQLLTRQFDPRSMFEASLTGAERDWPNLCYESVSLIVYSTYSPTEEEEARLFYAIAKGLNAPQTLTRKAAFDCVLILFGKTGEEWINRLYKLIRKSAGNQHELVLRAMVDESFKPNLYTRH